MCISKPSHVRLVRRRQRIPAPEIVGVVLAFSKGRKNAASFSYSNSDALVTGRSGVSPTNEPFPIASLQVASRDVSVWDVVIQSQLQRRVSYSHVVVVR